MSIWEKNELPQEMKEMEDVANFIDANEDKRGGHKEEDLMELNETTQKLHEEMSRLEKLEELSQR